MTPALDLPELLTFALSLAGMADEAALGGFRRDLRISAKPDRTLVTHVDEAIERLIRERIRAAYPSHGLVGEEYGIEAGDAPTRWYIDPIDGTHNFVRGVPLFGTLLAVEHEGEVVLGVMSAPALGERWYATRGGGAWAVRLDGEPRRLRVSAVSRIDDAQLLYGSGFEIERSGRAPGFAALRGAVWRERGFGDFWGYALIAEGAGEGMVEWGPKSWDLAAPLVIVEEAGGRLTDYEGRRRIDGGEVLASNGVLHDELVARLRAVPGEGAGGLGSGSGRGSGSGARRGRLGRLVIWRWLGALIDAWLALEPVRRRLGPAWRALPGDAVGLAVVRLCGVEAPARRVTLADGTEGLLYEDPRLGQYLDNVPLRPYAQTLGRIIVAREPIPEGTIRHELEHVRQWSRLGPFFLPLYGLESIRALLLGGNRYLDNRFELAARSHETDTAPELMVREITGR